MCEGKESYIVNNKIVDGLIRPGSWVYYILRLSSKAIEAWDKELVVEFTVIQVGQGEKGHPVLLAKKNEYPSLVDYDHRFTSRLNYKTSMRFQIPVPSSLDDDLVFAISNIDYFVHEPFRYANCLLQPFNYSYYGV